MLQDIGVGLLLGVAANILTGNESKDAANIAFGAASALSPDIDFLVYGFKHRWKIDRWAYRHRELLHHPLLFSPIGAIIIAFFNPVFGALWFFGSLYHFIHDTYTAWGVEWLRPFRETIFVIRKDYPHRTVPNRKELTAIVEKLGNDKHVREENLVFGPELLTKLAILDLGMLLALPAIVAFPLLFWIPAAILLLRLKSDQKH